ncbi:mRNA decapping enzyme [Eptesipox virus]|uniref:mRNA decapping enzyme n=1 Tax=Eptesipox virus TaxID=1329402 RepID=A0A220T6G1_9POXV|nr:mRNA decapping enzyme [Eptesipox virus]ASK51292.1 mRNA decapping enzyme [Eptesipox virus]WAH71050.1 mRNA decapping enzyme [Eptesipox virus]
MSETSSSIIYFDTPRESISIESVSNIQRAKNTHVFAICITSDNKPIIAARRSSFAFQEIMAKRTTPETILKVPKKLLSYMYQNEIQEINRRLSNSSTILFSNIDFEELILLGGKINKQESINDCILREIKEESDSSLTIKKIGNKSLKLTIYDKLFNKTYISYCTICYVKENLNEVLQSRIYNVEIRELKLLFDCINNDKYEYLFYIYNTLYLLNNDEPTPI